MRLWVSRKAIALETDAGLTWRRWASWDAVSLPASVVNRQVSTRAIILGRPEAMRAVVSVSSYSVTASASRPWGWGTDSDPRIQFIAADRADTTVEVRPANPSKSRDVQTA